MPATVRDIYGAIDALAPFETAMDFDNVGLLVGNMDNHVDTVLAALDATPAVVQEAKRLGAQLLVTHHPIMFSPRQRLDEADPEAALIAEMIRCGVSMIAAHTNLDMAPGGINDVLAKKLSWQVDSVGEILRIGHWASPQRLGDLQAHAAERLGAQVLRFGGEDRLVTRFAICSGSGSSEVENAALAGADLFLTGEIKHDAALKAMQYGMAVLACGHRATEICAADIIAGHLQSPENKVKLGVRVFASQIDPFV